jgi:glycerol-3-phosphate acyltransferase PlsY
VDGLFIAIALIAGYLLGSIPFGLILTRLAGTGDIRNVGSGNIGATNVLRTGRKGLAAATLLGDMLKGAVAVLLLNWFSHLFGFTGTDFGLMAGLGAVLGHVFPVWLGFKGGKGVATYIGVLIAVSWPVAIAFGVIWGLVAASTRYSSLAGLLASAATPALLWLLAAVNAAIVFVILTALVWFMHRGNISRLVAGTEPKIGNKIESRPRNSATNPAIGSDLFCCC